MANNNQSKASIYHAIKMRKEQGGDKEMNVENSSKEKQGRKQGGKKEKKSIKEIFRNLLCCFMMSILVMQSVTLDSHAATQISVSNPRIMVTSYSVQEKTIIAGGHFTLNLTVQNTAPKHQTKNIKITVSSPEGNFLPADSAGNVFVPKLEGEETYDLSMKFQALPSLEEKSYKMDIKIEYEDWAGSYTVSDSIYLPVSLEQRCSISDIYVDDVDASYGDTVEVAASINNLGSGKLYNVSCKLTGPKCEEAEYYVGNVESGKRGSVDFLVKTHAIEAGKDRDKTMLTITYEDAFGNESTLEREIFISLKDRVYKDFETIKEAPVENPNTKKVILGCAAAVIILILIVLGQIRSKKKKKELDEFING